MKEVNDEAGAFQDIPLVSAYAGDMKFMVPFIREGGAVSHSNAHGDTILHADADGWQHRMVEFLILSGVDVNIQNKDGDTALHTVTRSRTVPAEGRFLRDSVPEKARKETFRELLLFGKVDAEILNVQGANALHLAAHEGDSLAITELLMARRELVDKVTSKGATALLLAILREHVECAKLLISFGADISVTLTDGVRRLDLLRSGENVQLRLLCDAASAEGAEPGN